ncbi:MAG: glycosyltransferase family 2 protein [Candidatus Hydrogenedentes bacterium]|nr:glycosyltransferase family 2 protein [Candidatus Hydrogenedentota bacterium]
MNLSIVVPVYNSELSLRPLADRLRQVLSEVAEFYELILVDDGSRDGSWEVVESLVAEFPWIRGVQHLRNFGQHNALLCGIREARHEVIVTLDDDLQHPPEEISKLLAKLAEGYDVVYGAPESEQHGLLRDLASVITKLTLRGAMGIKSASNVSAFRVFRTELRDAFASYSGSFVSIDVLLTWGTTKFSAVTVRHDPRRVGASNYTFPKLLTHAVNMLTGFSIWPLQVASVIGFCFTIVGFLVLIYVLGRFAMEGSSVPGFPFLASMIAIFSGAQLFALGIIGEYIARMHFRSIEKPAYVVRCVAENISRVHPDDTCHRQKDQH